MDNYQKIKDLGAIMLSEADSSDKQEFGSFYLSDFLVLRLLIRMIYV